jgi:hypothetical protein
MKRLWKSIAFFAIANMLVLTAAHAEQVKQGDVIDFLNDRIVCTTLDRAVQMARWRETQPQQMDIEFRVRNCGWVTGYRSGAKLDLRIGQVVREHVFLRTDEVALCIQPINFGVNTPTPPCNDWIVAPESDVVVWR